MTSAIRNPLAWSSRPTSWRQSEIGFTLVELLVVVAIITVLLALLVPGLEKAIKAAENVKCMSNVRTVGVTLTLYHADSKRYYPQTPYFGMLFGNAGATGYQGVNYTVTQRPLNRYLGYTGDGGKVPVAECPLDKGDPLVASNSAYKDWGNSYIEFTWRDWYRFKKVFGGLTWTPDPLTPGNPNSIRQNSLVRTDNKGVIADWPVFGDRSYDDIRSRWHTDETGEYDRKYTTLFADTHVEIFAYPRSQMEGAWSTVPPDSNFDWW